MSILRSPNEIQDAAKAQMLDGREPTTERDWALCVNFWAVNAQAGLEQSICKLMALIFSCPLSENHIRDIVKFQQERK